MFDVTRNPFKAAIALAAASLIFVGEIQAQSQTFTSSGSYTVPAGVTTIVVQAWGAGGGGGSGNAGNNSRGGGGGGAFAASILPVTPGNTYAVIVGAGGSPGVDGGSSSFGGFLVVADGGEAGETEDGGNGGSTGASTGMLEFAGGDGGNRNEDDGGGGGGGSAFQISPGLDGSNGGSPAGGAGGLGTGDGGDGGANNGSGEDGYAPGGGGGGKGDNGTSSGTGADGRVIVTAVDQEVFLTSSGTFTVPAGVTNIVVQAWGGGGGGGIGDGSDNSRGGGGGGAFAASLIQVSPGNTYTVVIGAGGDPGEDGGNTTFGGTLVVAEGGDGGEESAGGDGGSTAGSTGMVEFAGGDGGNRDFNDGGGGGGGSATQLGNGGDGGNGGNPNGGAGGTGTGNGGDGGDDDGVPANEIGQNGFAPGGGGGGKGNGGASSGSGADGQVIVMYSTAISQQIFTTNDNFEVPAGVTEILVQAWGGGGAGRSGTNDNGGGGGGAFATRLMAVTPGQIIPVTIGSGGTFDGDPGDPTQFGTTSPVLVIAAGGASGPGNFGALGGLSSSCTPVAGARTGGSGGAIDPDGGDFAGGGGGGSAFSYAAGGGGGTGSGSTGGAGGIGQGNGGMGGSGVSGSGSPGVFPGGGGGGRGGATGAASGGVGASGRVIVTWADNAALPVTWLSFRATLNEDKEVDLLWSTASESDNEGFDIERSANARDWETIAFVPGAGTTSEKQEYQFTDTSPCPLLPAPCTAYYRLKQRDFSGAFEYSPVRTVELSNQNDIRVYPNPTDEELTISFAELTEARGTVQLFNPQGRLVAEQPIPPGTTEQVLRVSNLPAGMYILKVSVGAEQWNKRVVVE